MPYPHKNSDGKATLGHDEKGMPKPVPSFAEYSANHPVFHGTNTVTHSNFHKEMEEQVEKIKAEYKANFAKYNAKVLGEWPAPGEVGKPTGKSVKDLDKLLKDQYVNFHIHKPDDPILIPATGSYKDLYAKPAASMPISSYVPPLEHLRIEARVSGTVDTKKYGFAQALDPYKDYTEQDVRRLLMQGFGKMTDMIIEELKKEKK